MSHRSRVVLECALATALCVNLAEAAARVALVSDPARTTEYERSVLQQLRAELEADGFEVVSAAGHSDSPAALEEVAGRTESFAAIRFSRPDGSVAADVWIADRITGKTLVRRVGVDGRDGEAARTLALRAVELLRASLLELKESPLDSGTRRDVPIIRDWIEPKREPAAPSARAFGVWIGAAVLGHPGGLDAGVAPALGVSWRALPAIVLELELMMPVLGEQRGPAGSADIDQELLLASVRLEPISPHVVVAPFVAAGLGAYRLGASGDARPPFEERRDAQVVAAASLGAGLRGWLHRGAGFDLGIVLEGSAISLMPRPILLFAGRDEAKTGQPLLALTAAAEAAW